MKSFQTIQELCDFVDSLDEQGVQVQMDGKTYVLDFVDDLNLLVAGDDGRFEFGPVPYESNATHVSMADMDSDEDEKTYYLPTLEFEVVDLED